MVRFNRALNLPNSPQAFRSGRAACALSENKNASRNHPLRPEEKGLIDDHQKGDSPWH